MALVYPIAGWRYLLRYIYIYIENLHAHAPPTHALGTHIHSEQVSIDQIHFRMRHHKISTHIVIHNVFVHSYIAEQADMVIDNHGSWHSSHQNVPNFMQIVNGFSNRCCCCCCCCHSSSRYAPTAILWLPTHYSIRGEKQTGTTPFENWSNKNIHLVFFCVYEYVLSIVYCLW